MTIVVDHKAPMTITFTIAIAIAIAIVLTLTLTITVTIISPNAVDVTCLLRQCSSIWPCVSISRTSRGKKQERAECVCNA